MNHITIPLLTVPLESEAHRVARQFAVEQATPQKGKQVYLNTLSVYALHYYFMWQGIETVLAQSDCWNPISRLVLNIADLQIPHVGKLECRPVLPQAKTVEIPLEAQDDRIGFAAVGLNEPLNEATLLGFLPTVTAEDIPIEQWQSFEMLFTHLSIQSIVNPTQWLQENFEQGWHSLQDLFGSSTVSLGYALRNAPMASDAFTAGKLFNLNVRLESHSLLLLVGIALEPDQRWRIMVRLCSALSHAPLPPNLSLRLRTQSGQVLAEVQQPTTQDYLQLLPFRLQHQTQFSVEIALDGVQVSEQFTV